MIAASLGADDPPSFEVLACLVSDTVKGSAGYAVSFFAPEAGEAKKLLVQRLNEDDQLETLLDVQCKGEDAAVEVCRWLVKEWAV